MFIKSSWPTFFNWSYWSISLWYNLSFFSENVQSRRVNFSTVQSPPLPKIKEVPLWGKRNIHFSNQLLNSHEVWSSSKKDPSSNISSLISVSDTSIAHTNSGGEVWHIIFIQVIYMMKVIPTFVLNFESIFHAASINKNLKRNTYGGNSVVTPGERHRLSN